MLEEYEKRALENPEEEEWEHDEIEQAKLDREIGMEEQQKETKKKEKRKFEEETDKNIEGGGIPKQISNLKQQYDRLLRKVKEKELELKDLEGEHVGEKLDYLEALREQKKETKFLSKLLPRLLNLSDIDKLRMKSTWDDNNNCFITPGFLVRSKQITMPKMPKKERNIH